MKPRLYLKIGILLAEVLFLTFIVMFSFGQLREKDSPAIEMAANPSDDFSQNTAQEMPPTNVPPSHDGDENNRQQPPGENAPDQGTATATPVDCGPPANWTLHQVREGETVISLAQFLGVSSDDLRQANCLGEAGVLTAGMKLFVPYPVPTADVVMQTPTPAESQMPAQPTEVIETSLEAEPTQIAEIEGPETAADTEFVEFDLRAVDQSGEYVSNPGMGWQYEGGSFPITTPAETVAYSQRSLISWKIINPQEGVYNWTPLDNQLNTAVGQGKQFSFRVYTMMGGSWGPHQVPDWVLAKGAQILPSGEPNYANCTYQQEWGNFVNAVISRYDGNSNIAFIDISGYGQFNEWSWNDQTEWDYLWAEQYASGTAGADTMSTIDSYTRRVLADIYIGGSFTGHECVDASSNVQTVNYNYPGFQSTQLVLPYAGIAQSTQYVLTRSQNVGFRFDCMGRSGDDLVEKVGAELNAIYPNAPIIYETCSAGDFNLAEAMYLIENTHPILIHDGSLDLEGEGVLPLLEPLGYQYSLTYLRHSTRGIAGEPLDVIMRWQNEGITPYYPRMGQDFELHIYLVDQDGQRRADMTLPADISTWMPAAGYNGTPPEYSVIASPLVPGDVPPGVYTLDIEIVDTRTGDAIWHSKEILLEPRMQTIIIID